MNMAIFLGHFLGSTLGTIISVLIVALLYRPIIKRWMDKNK